MSEDSAFHAAMREVSAAAFFGGTRMVVKDIVMDSEGGVVIRFHPVGRESELRETERYLWGLTW